MPVEFLTDEQAGAYGRFSGPPSRMHLERFFFLDDEDRGLIGRRRGDHNRLGFAVQLTTVRFVGTFVADPVDVPGGVVEYLAEQLNVAAASMATYTQREKTRLEHQWEIARKVGYHVFTDAEAELAVWVDDRAWTTGEGPVGVQRRRWLVARAPGAAASGHDACQARRART